jgi:hypothetical protein
MLQPADAIDLGNLADRLRKAGKIDMSLMSDAIGMAHPVRSLGHSEKAARLGRLIRSGAWTDAALALIDLELPRWQIRRLVYDDGEWHCALSRDRALPDWLDGAIETHHADLALAILSACVEACSVSQSATGMSVPIVNRNASELDASLSVDNFS